MASLPCERCAFRCLTLLQELQAFLGDDEFILVSLGTILYLTDSIIHRLKNALLKLPYKVFLRKNSTLQAMICVLLITIVHAGSSSAGAITWKSKRVSLLALRPCLPHLELVNFLQ
jgi:hypothetical protein